MRGEALAPRVMGLHMVDSLAILSLPVAFLLGSIPFGVILSRAFGLPDPRKIGSGNIGATNVLRSGRKDVAALTMLMDGLKGVLAVTATGFASEAFMPAAALLAVLGHVFSPWLGFKGGKGVATSFGVVFAISPMTGFFAMFTWLLTFTFLKISSLAALVTFISLPIVMWLDMGALHATVSIFLAALIFHTHRQNIMRLMNGTESKFTLKGAVEDATPETDEVNNFSTNGQETGTEGAISTQGGASAAEHKTGTEAQ